MKAHVAWLVLAGCLPGSLLAADLVCLSDAARTQIGVTLRYDPAYVQLSYPGGDVPADRGVCTDVVIRAFRVLGVDLQQQVHEDMRAHFSRYPKNWGLQATDRNIDHRRVPNLATFFARKGQTLSVDTADADWQAGDIVTWRLPSGVPHIGIISNQRGASGAPLVVHNIGLGTRLDDSLHAFTITGAFRYRPGALAQGCPQATP
jgi:hypothetical protein